MAEAGESWIGNAIYRSRTVKIADLAISEDPEEVLVTYSLGSCVGVSVYDPVSGLAGLIHCMLPSSKRNLERAKREPAMFVDTGVVLLLSEMLARGAVKEQMIIRVAGGGCPMDENGAFQIGANNLLVLNRLLQKNDLRIASQDVGGIAPRTMRLFVVDGHTTVVSYGRERDL